MRGVYCFEKMLSGHHVQVDIKFLFFTDAQGKHIKYFQYRAIDDYTSISALKIYEGHTQTNAINFINIVKIRFQEASGIADKHRNNSVGIKPLNFRTARILTGQHNQCYLGDAHEAKIILDNLENVLELLN